MLSFFPQPGKGDAGIPGPPPPAGKHPIKPHHKKLESGGGGLSTLLPFWGTRSLLMGWAPSPAPGPSPGSPRQKAALHEKSRLAWPSLGTQRGGSPDSRETAPSPTPRPHLVAISNSLQPTGLRGTSALTSQTCPLGLSSLSPSSLLPPFSFPSHCPTPSSWTSVLASLELSKD